MEQLPTSPSDLFFFVVMAALTIIGLIGLVYGLVRFYDCRQHDQQHLSPVRRNHSSRR
jgi:hypothetical protein